VASARKVELDCEASFGITARRVIKVRAKEVFKQADGVLDLGEVEHVHDMRVATRRLRAALEVFEECFPGKRHRKALKKVKALADALGERRDADVEIEFLEGLVSEVATVDREELEALTAEMRARQRRANEELAPFVTAKRLRKLRRRLAKLAKAAKG
jgi:CHAD domain-containing protein